MSAQLGFVFIAAVAAVDLIEGSLGTSGCALKYKEHDSRFTP